jgi:tetratricopeptide (TPR) repeat protein
MYKGWGDPSQWEPSVAILQHVLVSRRRLLGPSHPETLRTQSLLAFPLLRLGRLDEAMTQWEQAEAIALKVLGADHPTTLEIWGWMSHGVAARGDHERAVAMLRRVVVGQDHVLGPLDGSTIETVRYLADALREGGRLDEARDVYLDALDRKRQVHGLSHIACSAAIGGLISVARQQGDYAAIHDLCQGWIQELMALPPDPDPYELYRYSVRLSGLALTLAMLPEAVPFDAALAVRAAEEAATLSGDWDDAWTVVGVVHYRTGQLDKAMQAIQNSMARPRWKGGDDFDWLMLALIHARRGELAEARTWYDKARNRKDPVDFNREDLRPLREEAVTLLGLDAPERGPKRAAEPLRRRAKRN